MPNKILRGRILTFHSDPTDPDDTEAYSYIEDGALLIANGVIKVTGPYTDIVSNAADIPVIDHRPHILMAGFIDTHIHFPQVQIVASWGSQLLDWLNGYTFPAESEYADAQHARAMAGRFCDLLASHGTTTAVAFCSSHKTSAEATTSIGSPTSAPATS